jgi:hypothetical protein
LCRIANENRVSILLNEVDKNQLRLEWLRKSLKKSDYIIDDYIKTKIQVKSIRFGIA